MQEAFVATLLILARGSEMESSAIISRSEDEDGPEQYKFYRIIKEEAQMLREDMDKSEITSPVPLVAPNTSSPGPWAATPGATPAEQHATIKHGEELKNLPVRSYLQGDPNTSAVQSLRRYFSVRP